MPNIQGNTYPTSRVLILLQLLTAVLQVYPGQAAPPTQFRTCKARLQIRSMERQPEWGGGEGRERERERERKAKELTSQLQHQAHLVAVHSILLP